MFHCLCSFACLVWKHVSTRLKNPTTSMYLGASEAQLKAVGLNPMSQFLSHFLLLLNKAIWPYYATQ